MDYVGSHDSADIAKVIKPQFKETDMDALISIVERYRSQNTWKEDTVFKQESFDLLQTILDKAGQLDKKADYNLLVNTEYSSKAVKK